MGIFREVRWWEKEEDRVGVSISGETHRPGVLVPGSVHPLAERKIRWLRVGPSVDQAEINSIRIISFVGPRAQCGSAPLSIQF